MRPLHFPIQPRRVWLDVAAMRHTKILYVPVEPGLEFMAVIRANRVDAERELRYSSLTSRISGAAT
jgi:hypothetical protein